MSSTTCWLCRHSQHPDARLHHSYIVDNAGAVCPKIMALEIHRDLYHTHPDAVGTEADTILEHITQHSLNPTVNIASMLRSLIALRDKMQKNLLTYDEDGNASFEPKMIDSYLKVQSQIILAYRQEDGGKKLMFHDKS